MTRSIADVALDVLDLIRNTGGADLAALRDYDEDELRVALMFAVVLAAIYHRHLREHPEDAVDATLDNLAENLLLS